MPEEKTVSFRVFLPEETRIRFKIATAKDKSTMSAKALELIEEWLKSVEGETNT